MQDLTFIFMFRILTTSFAVDFHKHLFMLLVQVDK